jgi:hypothetical protein
MHQRVLAVLLLAILVGCGGGGGGEPPPPRGDLWFGTLEDEDFLPLAVSVWIDGSEITEVRENGFRTGVTGTIGTPLGTVRPYSFTDGTVPELNGVFIVSASGTHMAFADEAFNFGVLQKGVTGLPVYSYTDLIGTFSGRSVQTDFGTSIIEDTSSLTCSQLVATLICTITIVGGATLDVEFSGPFDPGFGRWEGLFAGPSGITGSVSAFLSPDKTFVSAWACTDPDQIWPDDCAYSAWQR